MNIRRKRLLPSLALVAAALACSGEESISGVGADNASAAARRPAAFSPTLTPQQSGTLNRLQAVSPVNAKVVWASGVGGTFALTTDGGEHWTSRVVPGAETLQFRDVEGVSDKVAYLLSAGVGTDSRIYKTEDSGNTWTLQFQNEDPNGFYDCFAFFNPRRGITMADAVNGRFRSSAPRTVATGRTSATICPARRTAKPRSPRAGHASPPRARGGRGSGPAPPRRRGSSPPPTAATAGRHSRHQSCRGRPPPGS